MEALAHAAFEILERIILGTARVLIPLASNGRWRCDEPSTRTAPRPSGLLSYQANGQRFITDTGQLLVGVVFYAVTGGAFILSLG
ncbi:hypothetical protein [Acidovorax sp. SDU_ACID1]|uniref:hypothetical protein n=1 Tax=Acidovorax sp. SDU_ACID1 TaxID=3136632 RepID=UPI003872C13E